MNRELNRLMITMELTK